MAFRGACSGVLRRSTAQTTRQRARAGPTVVVGLSGVLRDVHTSSPRSASVAPGAEETTGSSYVSPHDWKKLREAYGKPTLEGAVMAPMEIEKLELKSRREADQGSRFSRKIREDGQLPGVLYGPGRDGDDKRILVTFSRLDLERQMRRLGDSLESTVFEVVVDGHYKQKVILRDLDRDPATAVPRSINFLRYRPGFPVKVPVCFTNEELCIPIKRGGLLVSINRFIRVTCEGETIPEMLLTDLTGAHSNEKVGIERVTFPPGVQPYRLSKDFFLGVVKGKGSVEAAAAAQDGVEDGEQQEGTA